MTTPLDQADAAYRLSRGLRAAAAFTPTPEARTTLEEASHLLRELANVAGKLDAVLMDREREERQVTELREALEQERAWLPSGLYLLRREEGSVSRAWVPQVGDEDLEALMPRAALLRHRGAVTRAVMAVYDQVREGAVRDEQGVPTRLTWPAGAEIADLILAEVERDLKAGRP